jgi:hypothetical protein
MIILEKLNSMIMLNNTMNELTIDKYWNLSRLMKIAKQMPLRKNRHLVMIVYLQRAKESLREGDIEKADSLAWAAQKILFEEMPWMKECFLEFVKSGSSNNTYL